MQCSFQPEDEKGKYAILIERIGVFLRFVSFYLGGEDSSLPERETIFSRHNYLDMFLRCYFLQNNAIRQKKESMPYAEKNE